MPSRQKLAVAEMILRRHLISLSEADMKVALDDARRAMLDAGEWEGSAYFTHYRDDTGSYDVTIRIDRERILLTCACGTPTECRHVRAAVADFLLFEIGVTEQELDEDRDALEVSEGSSGAIDGTAAKVATEKFHQDRVISFAERLEMVAEKAAAALGRKVTPAERKWLSSVVETHERLRWANSVTSYAFSYLGLAVPDDFEQDYWPKLPNDPWTFLVWLVATHSMTGLPLNFLIVSPEETAAAVEEIRRFRRTKDVARWNSVFDTVAKSYDASTAPSVLEFRAIVHDGSVGFEWRRRDSARFTAIDKKALDEIGGRIKRGALTVSESWGPIESIIRQMLTDGGSRCSIRAPGPCRTLFSHYVRQAGTAQRLFDRNETPIEVDNRPLHFESSPSDDGEDIRVSLVDPDGTAVDRHDFLSPDLPRILIANGRLFDNLPAIPDLGAQKVSAWLPKKSIDSAAGVEFFHRFRIPLPPDIEKRVVRLALRPIATADIVANPNDDSELLRLKFHAESPGGRVLCDYDGDRWVTARNVDLRTPLADPNLIRGAVPLLERSALSEADRKISALGWRMKPGDTHFEKKLTKSTLAALAEWTHAAKDVFEFRFSGDIAGLPAATVSGRLEVEVEEDSVDWFDLRLVVRTDDATLTTEEIALLTAAKGDLVKLPNRGWRRISLSLSEEDDRKLAELGLSIRDLSEKKQRFHALQLSGAGAQKLLPPDLAGAVKKRADEITLAKAVNPPKGLTAELRPYQVEGFRFLTYLTENGFGGILADDMGLGKTVQALAWIVWLRTKAKKKKTCPALVVCPKSVADNWRAEAEKFVPDLRTRVWSAKDLVGLEGGLADADLHVINYHQLRSAETALKAVKWGACILDEAQAIKNPSSLTAQIACALKTEQRLVMTGTPVENRCLDLWSLMNFAMPGVLGPRAHFLRIYEAKDDPLARRRLAARVRPFLLRRTKDTVAADLPPKVEEDLYCEMEGVQATLYRAELKKAQQMLLAIKTQSEVAKIQFNVLTSLLRLRQICCDPRLANPEAKGSSAKIEALMEHLEPLIGEGQKVVVFSQFVEAIDLLEEATKPLECPIFRLTGSTEGRGEIVRNFQSTEGAAIFLVSLRAGGFGVNLTAASYVVLFDPWWNPAVENQAIDRTHRIGQSKTVFAHRILVKGTIEEKIRVLQKRKAAVADEIFGEERFSQSLSLDDLKFLFAD